MKKEEEENGREIQTKSRTINQSALAVQKKNSSEKGIIQAYKKENIQIFLLISQLFLDNSRYSHLRKVK